MRRICGLLVALVILAYCSASEKTENEQKETVRKQMAKLLELNPDKCRSLVRINNNLWMLSACA
jgi:ABC-type Fe3+-citrate transport system substrate-binding protein